MQTSFRWRRPKPVLWILLILAISILPTQKHYFSQVMQLLNTAVKSGLSIGEWPSIDRGFLLLFAVSSVMPIALFCTAISQLLRRTAGKPHDYGFLLTYILCVTALPLINNLPVFNICFSYGNPDEFSSKILFTYILPPLVLALLCGALLYWFHRSGASAACKVVFSVAMVVLTVAAYWPFIPSAIHILFSGGRFGLVFYLKETVFALLSSAAAVLYIASAKRFAPPEPEEA